MPREPLLSTPLLVPGLTSTEHLVLDQISVGRCHLTQGLVARLRRNNLRTLGDIARTPTSALFRIRGIKQGRLMMLRERILEATRRTNGDRAATTRDAKSVAIAAPPVVAKPIRNAVPTVLKLYLAGRQISQAGLDPDRVVTLGRAGIETLADVARTDRAAILRAVGEDATRHLADLIASYYRLALLRYPDAADERGAFEAFTAWLEDAADEEAKRPDLTPVLRLTPQARALLATYPCPQPNTTVTGLLTRLAEAGAATLAAVADYAIEDLLAGAYIGRERIARLQAYLEAVIAGGEPYRAPIEQHLMPPAIVRRASRIDLATIDIPDDARAWLADRHCATLAQLVRYAIPDLQHLPEAERWIQHARERVSVMRWEIEAETGQPVNLVPFANFRAWLDPSIGRSVVPDGHVARPFRLHLPLELSVHLEGGLLSEISLPAPATIALNGESFRNLAHIAQMPRAYIAKIAGESAAETLSGFITARYQRMIRRSPGARLKPGAHPEIEAWLLPAHVAAPPIAELAPILPLTEADRALLATYPCEIKDLAQDQTLAVLKRRGITNLAALADQSIEDLLTVPGIAKRRIDNMVSLMRAILVRREIYRRPIRMHPIPRPLAIVLCRVSLEEAGIPPQAIAWLDGYKCRDLADLTRFPVSALWHLPQSEQWMRTVRQEVSYARWGLEKDPLDVEAVDAHLYDNFKDWIDPAIEKPVYVPVPLLKVEDPDLRSDLAERSVPSLEGTGIGIRGLNRLVEAGYPTLLTLADADVGALLKIAGYGAKRVADLHAIVQSQVEIAAAALAERTRRAIPTAGDEEWDAAAPTGTSAPVQTASAPEPTAATPIAAFIAQHVRRDLTDLLAIEAETNGHPMEPGQFLAVSPRLRDLLQGQRQRVGYALGCPVWQRLSTGPLESDPVVIQAQADDGIWEDPRVVAAAKAMMRAEPAPAELFPTMAELDAYLACEFTGQPWERTVEQTDINEEAKNLIGLEDL